MLAEPVIEPMTVERLVLVTDLALRSWPATDGEDNMLLLTQALADLSRWSSWAVTRRELNTPGVYYQLKESDIVHAWQKGLNYAKGDVEEDEPGMAYRESDVGASAEVGEVKLPRIASNSPHFGYRDGVHRAHEQLSRWNLRREVIDLDVHTLGDAMGDLILWSQANDVDFDQAFAAALDITDGETN